MLNKRLTLYLSAMVLLGACGGDLTQAPTDPSRPDAGQPQLTAPTSPYCSVTSADVLTAIHDLFVKNSWPDENSAIGKFKTVQDYLDAGDLDAAIAAADNLIRFMELKFGQLTPTQQAAAQDLYDQLVAAVWCYVGFSGVAFDLNPTDTTKAFEIPGVGGIVFPAFSAPVPTKVFLTDLSAGPCPLATFLDCFTGYLDITLYPNNPIQATMVLCPPSGAPTTLAIGHQLAPGAAGFEILPVVPVPVELSNTCASTLGQEAEPTGWLMAMWQRTTDLLLPQTLQASGFPMVGAGGVGGLIGSYSPTGIVSVDLGGAGGVGGLGGSYVPPSSLNPSLPTGGYYSGAAGSSADSVVAVTIQTRGGDDDGQNPAPGIKVTFSVGPTQNYDPDSNPSVCDAQGTAVASIDVYTDVNGVAVLPCFQYGTKAGFANLKATFDPTSLNLPGTYQITINGSTTSSLNWLMVTEPGPATQVLTYMGSPAATAQTYSYGTGLTAFTDVSPAPQVIVTDDYGNPVANEPLTWTATTINGGVLTTSASASPTDSVGTASADSWTLGDGANVTTVKLTNNSLGSEAVFTADTPTGISIFACTNPTAKTDVGPMTIKAPKGTIRSVTLQMSITGTSSSVSDYDANMVVTLDGSNTVLGSTTGKVQLPGDNGKPVPVTFTFATPIGKQSGGSTLRFNLSIATPANRRPQVWYNSSKLKQNDPCYGSLVYDPLDSSSFNRGLAIDVTN